MDAFCDVENFGPQRLPSCKREELACELGGAGHGLTDRVDVAAPSLLREIGPVQEVDRRADDGEQVVEVVSDAPCELAHGLHLLRLSKLLLSRCKLRLPLPLGCDVAGGSIDQATLRG